MADQTTTDPLLADTALLQPVSHTIAFSASLKGSKHPWPLPFLSRNTVVERCRPKPLSSVVLYVPELLQQCPHPISPLQVNRFLSLDTQRQLLYLTQTCRLPDPHMKQQPSSSDAKTRFDVQKSCSLYPVQLGWLPLPQTRTTPFKFGKLCVASIQYFRVSKASLFCNLCYASPVSWS
jgi:hypothetical protein